MLKLPHCKPRGDVDSLVACVRRYRRSNLGPQQTSKRSKSLRTLPARFRLSGSQMYSRSVAPAPFNSAMLVLRRVHGRSGEVVAEGQPLDQVRHRPLGGAGRATSTAAAPAFNLVATLLIRPAMFVSLNNDSGGDGQLTLERQSVRLQPPPAPRR